MAKSISTTLKRTAFSRFALFLVVFSAAARLGAQPLPADAEPAEAEPPESEQQLGPAIFKVTRPASASDCASAAELAERLKPLVDGAPPLRPLFLSITWSRSAASYHVEIVLREGGSGSRELTSDAASCSDLVEKVVAVLAVLLEGESASPETPQLERSSNASGSAESGSRASIPSGGTAPPAADPPNQPDRASVDVSPKRPEPFGGVSEPGLVRTVRGFGHAGLTVGLAPEPRIFAAAEVRLLGNAWLAGLLLFSTLPESTAARDGAITTTWVGATVKPCLLLLGTPMTLHWTACALGSVAALHAEAKDYPVVKPAVWRPWYALGGGLGLASPAGGDLHWTLDVAGAVPLTRDRFSVRNVGTVWQAPGFSAWLSFGLGIAFL